MKRIFTLTVLAFITCCSLFAQDRISVFIGNANRYASVDLSDFNKRLSLEYNVNSSFLPRYYRSCGSDWGNVGIALEIARISGRSINDVCRYYNKYRRDGWGRVLVELGFNPGTRYYERFYDRMDSQGRYWNDNYNVYCQKHGYGHSNGLARGHYKNHGKDYDKKHGKKNKNKRRH